MQLAGQPEPVIPEREVGPGTETGYAMAALLVGLSVMAIVLSAVMPVWKHMVQREKEAELIFRGQQYVRAIELMQRKLPGALPPNIDVLVDQHFLRKKYKDPITGEDFDLLRPTQAAPTVAQQPGGASGRGQAPGPVAGIGRQGGAAGGGRQGAPAGGGVQAGIYGVASKSKETSIRLYNGRSHYNEWQFIHVARAPAPGAGGAVPGQSGPGRGQGSGPGNPGTGDGRGRGQQPPDGGRGTSPFGGGRGPGPPNQPFPPNRPPGR